MPGRIQEMPQSWLTASRPVTEIVKQPSTGLVKDSSLNKDIKTAETQKLLEEIDAQMKVICAWEMDSTTVDQCIKELCDKIGALYNDVLTTRSQVYEMVLNYGTESGQMVRLREGCNAADRDRYLEKLIAYNHIRQAVSDKVAKIEKHTDSVKRMVDLHHYDYICGDLKALNKNGDVPKQS
ncbi:NleF caspase inhibitor [Yersinia pseudotuberculosis]|uniref:NleF caspase inhibitor n=1 Tax=Yersinia pseudotuberculosis TaxID=633 RepID=UPI0005E61AA2|nr:NleF caspase inhibitor [Yersinia pseudotuberculosis]AXY33586.1 hypothetical protein CEQ20_09255 [Yersinia pseudotuberculosis]AYX13279.1 hypothetical protein EGX52_22295 [Yersinia pseudotuberculosis]MBO1548583.1 hypothetical protein [Yersinia pseudotuberculosis]MBO1568267.1 hypothetical protein [Yersinia pseudotuberculosis]MBO1571748.1 hypothetical protein [Yersinia pseudotuberculosis]